MGTERTPLLINPVENPPPTCPPPAYYSGDGNGIQGLKKWVEIGNSGVFRPEMLLPMGLPEGVNVIAWGLSLERPTMIKYGINNIRELFGPKVNHVDKMPYAFYFYLL